MIRLGLICGLLAALALPPAARAAEQIDFAAEKFFLIGSSLADANRLLADEKSWEVGMRIDTPSVSRISCRYLGELIYMVEFFQGQCYSIEKRLIIPAAEVEPLFKRFQEVLGPAPESTQDDAGTLYYSHWYDKQREVELTIYEHQDGNFMATLEDYLPEVAGEARSTMEQEVMQQPTEVDPITGQPRVIPQDESGQDGGGGGAEEGQDKGTGKDKEKGKGKDKEEPKPDPAPDPKTDKPKEDPKDPPPDPVEWDDL